jgi:hypothetical protein
MPPLDPLYQNQVRQHNSRLTLENLGHKPADVVFRDTACRLDGMVEIQRLI